MPADIRYTIVRGATTYGPFTNTSENILRKGDVVNLECPNIDQTSYQWVLSYKPVSSGGTSSTATLTSAALRTTSFTADFDGAYLVQLTVNQGVVGEDTQFVRIRGLTKFANLGLIAAGERYNQEGPVPIDATAQGWADFLNNNIQKLLSIVRRKATSARVLYVDANRPRGWEGVGLSDGTLNPANDPTKSIHYPGTDQTSSTTDGQTGVDVPTEGIGDFGTIQAAMDYALTMTPVPSLENPVWVSIKPGLYKEDLTFYAHVYPVADSDEAGMSSFAVASVIGGVISSTALARTKSVVVQTVTSAGHSWDAPNMPPVSGAAAELTAFFDNMPVVLSYGISYENWIVSGATPSPLMTMTGTGALLLNNVDMFQAGSTITQEAGATILFENPIHGVNPLQRDLCMCIVSNSTLSKTPVTGDVEPLLKLDSAGIYTMVNTVQLMGGAYSLQIPDDAAVTDGGVLGAKASWIDISMTYNNGGSGTPADNFLKGVPNSLTVEHSNIDGNILIDSDLVTPDIDFSPSINLSYITLGGEVEVNDDIFLVGTGAAISLGMVDYYGSVGVYDTHPVILSAAPTRVDTTITATNGPTYGALYNNRYVPPELGSAGVTVLDDGQRMPDDEQYRSMQSATDMLFQLSLPDAPPVIGDVDYSATRGNTPSLGSMYNGVWRMDGFAPVEGDGFGRIIDVSLRDWGSLNGYLLPVQIQHTGVAPTLPSATDRRLLRFGTGNEVDGGVYVDVGCESHGVLKVYGSVEATSPARSTHFDEITSDGGTWPYPLGGNIPGGHTYNAPTDTLIYGVFYVAEITDPTLHLPTSHGLIGTATQYPVEGQIVTVKDISGTATAHPITIQVRDSGGATDITNVQVETVTGIMGSKTSITVDHGSITFVYHVRGTVGYWHRID